VAFANYYFNKKEQDRVLKGMQDLGDFSKAGGEWTLSGKTAKGESFTAKIADEKVEFELGDKSYTETGEFEDLPPKSGGLLTALNHLWRFFAHRDKFTEFYYLGSEPLDGSGEKVDVIVAVKINVESRWYFDRESGELLGFDTRLAENEDDCEIRIQGWEEFEGKKLPNTLTVSTGGDDFATLEITGAEFQSAESGN